MMHHDDKDPRGLRRISELSGYTVSEHDPDIRGWSVIGAEGQVIGEVDDLFVDTAQMKVREIDVDVKGGGHVHVPAEQAQVDAERRQVRIAGLAGGQYEATRGYDAGHRAAGYAGDDVDRDRRLTRSEEELRVGKQSIEAGEAVVGKHVETERVQQPVSLRREEVVIERRPVGPGTSPDAATLGDEVVRVPLTREEAVVEKRPVVKEELVIGKRVVEDHETVEAEVRREEFDIENPAGGPPRPKRRS
jgi:uncharacterized protein (TIGR02271 family)